MAVYPEKRKGKFTGVWVAEAFVNGARIGRERFQSQQDAERWHDYMKVTGAPPPGNTASGKQAREEFGPTVAAVIHEAKQTHPGWAKNRDPGRKGMLNYIEDLWGRDTGIAKITVQDVDKLITSLRKRPGYQGRRMSDARVNRYLALASVILRFAKDQGYRLDVPKLRWQKEAGKRILWLSEEGEDKVCAWLQAHGWADSAFTVRVLVSSGMRWGEFERLEQRDVTEDGWIRLSVTKTDTPRDIPIAPELARDLRLFLRERRVLKRHTFAEHLHKALEGAGEDTQLTVHGLRHTFGTRLALADVNVRKIQELMGHSDIKTTMKYTHITKQGLRDAVKIFSRSAGETPKVEAKNPDTSVKKSA